MEKSVSELDVSPEDPAKAAQVYKEHGCLVLRGLFSMYVEAIHRDLETAAELARSLFARAEKVEDGWRTPDGTLLIPRQRGPREEKQIMVLACGYRQSGAFFASAMEPRLLNIMEAIIGPDIELFMDGQVVYKEPEGGHPKPLHQDASYFEHRYEGPVAVISHTVSTGEHNGALYVVPGSHKLGVLPHVDTFSHLGLDPKKWTWDKAVMISTQPGDAIVFHVNMIHGSKNNLSSQARPGFIHRYRRPDDYVTVSATNQANRKLAESKREEALKDNQEGFMVRGYRGTKGFS